MDINALGGGTSLTDALGGNEAMDRDAFLKLLVAQLQNQDPLEPQENSEFVAQLAQFSNLEQTIGINDRLDMLSIQNQGIANTEVVGLVDKTVTVKGTIATIDGSRIGSPVNFILDRAASEVTVTIRDQAGREVRTIDVGPSSAGAVNANWDGRDATGLPQPPGAYSILVEARDSNDAPVGVTQQSRSRVSGVSFEQGFPQLHLENGLSVPVADLLRVEPSVTNP